jgi:hypothetical protein
VRLHQDRQRASPNKGNIMTDEQTAVMAVRFARDAIRCAATDLDRAVAKTKLYHAIRQLEAAMPNEPSGDMFFKRQIG